MHAVRWLRLALALLVLCCAVEPWYLQAARPHHYSVGKASGLLSGLHHPPHTRRSNADGSAELNPAVPLPGSAHPPSGLRIAVSAVCGGDGHQPRSCRALLGTPGALQCKADVTVSLDPMECADA
ncbi:NPB protein, partial [Atrichornis clamosus]|nr:NPB protein [Atrichornis clamosus]